MNAEAVSSPTSSSELHVVMNRPQAFTGKTPSPLQQSGSGGGDENNTIGEHQAAATRTFPPSTFLRTIRSQHDWIKGQGAGTVPQSQEPAIPAALWAAPGPL